ncbi:MAG: MmgE/PrpD family protein [Christensenellales bacterium]|jgi:2-methylcitrate dehydratase PrpD
MNTNYTEIVSKYVSEMQYSDIPDRVIEQAKKVFLHTLAASISAFPQVRKVIDYVQQDGGAPEATIWCSDGEKVPADNAAFANGTIADQMDWEDCSWTGHPSATCIPAIFALAEARNKTGKDFLLALVTAYESSQRIAQAIQPTKEYVTGGNEWGLVSWQILPAALGAAKILDFNAKQVNQVLGAALYQTINPANKHSDGLGKSDIYHYAHGFCARNGLVSATITEAGFDNCYGALDGKDGYWHMVSDQVDESWYSKRIGDWWLIEETYLKHWPANMWAQTPLEALHLLMRERDFGIDDVEKIRVSPNIPFICSDYSKTTRSTLDAQFSIPYCFGAYLITKRKTADWFTEEMRNSQKLIDFTTKVECYGEIRGFFDNFQVFWTGSFPKATVDVHLKDGTVLTRTEQYPKGHPRNNFTMEEEIAHFRDCCSPYLPKENIDRFVEIVLGLENAKDLHELAKLTTIV